MKQVNTVMCVIHRSESKSDAFWYAEIMNQWFEKSLWKQDTHFMHCEMANVIGKNIISPRNQRGWKNPVWGKRVQLEIQVTISIIEPYVWAVIKLNGHQNNYKRANSISGL